ncbi:carbohydrate ABC transporter permease [Gorillibacterium sp. sgz5001074]|uniref:carbohydrate ABC transporter permease n=1 Tax=Gorillibacterium sp. sgz5001074 TaxID=3446695 RepID=UPI003F6629C0
MKKALSNPWTFLLFVTPAFLLYAVFFLTPMLASLKYGFSDWDGVNEPVFNGLDNFKMALQDENVWRAFRNNVYFILFSVFLQIPFIVFLAIIISNVKRLQGLYKTAVFIPNVLSTAVVGILWSFIYHPEAGLLNQLLDTLGFSQLKHTWLAEDGTAMLAILVTNAWQYVGFFVVLVLAAILGISKDIHEAAEMDGATGWTKAWKITVPLIRPVLLVIVLLSITGAMKALDIVMVMTNGGPAGLTEVMATYMIKQGNRLNEYGYANSISLLIVAFTLVLTAVFQIITKRLEGSDA